MIPFGPHKRKERPGVPQDHFVKVPWNDQRAKLINRYMAVNHQGRVTALVAHGPEEGDTLTLPFASAALVDDMPPELTVEEVLADVELLNEPGCVDAPWFDERPAIYGYLCELLTAFGIDDDHMPEMVDLGHSKFTGKHTHSHSAMGEQGDDSEHEHEHSHNGDASHSHTHMTTTTTATPVDPQTLAAKIEQLRERQAQSPEIERMTVTAVTAAGEVQIELPVRWDPEATDPFAKIGKDGTIPKGAFVSTLPHALEFAMVAAGGEMPDLVDNPGANWHAILCVEGLRTDEDPGREIMPGACRVPDLPVSLRLQIHDEGGHWGAVTCGRIDEMDRQDMQGYNAITGAGVFGTDEHGQLGQLLVTEQTQRFISIDPRDVTMEIVEVEINTSGYYDYDDDCEPDLYDWWVRYTDLVIGAATIVATPALPQSVITLANVELPDTPIAVANAGTSSITASATPTGLPPVEYFNDPGFHVGDPRLVRQADGHYACPLTVSEPDVNGFRRVFGHVAYWGSNHTGLPGQNRKPPHSPTYAYFMTGARMTSEGVKVPVGNLTMGCGHASTGIRDASKAKAHYVSTGTEPAHYDGGFGVVQMADVAAGEDDFGIWTSGIICEDRNEAEIRKFESLGMSGDWRDIAGALHMVACLAVPVPGFPIAREEALVASAEVIELRSVRAGIDEAGEVFALVAAGRVRRVPAEERLAQLEGYIDVLMRDRATRLEREALLSLVS